MLKQLPITCILPKKVRLVITSRHIIIILPEIQQKPWMWINLPIIQPWQQILHFRIYVRRWYSWARSLLRLGIQITSTANQLSEIEGHKNCNFLFNDRYFPNPIRNIHYVRPVRTTMITIGSISFLILISLKSKRISLTLILMICVIISNPYGKANNK